jgi:hypothetical protein
MADKLIFLSHIHEEKTLALLVKQALEAEFSGFVDVFVSSDGASIPAGANFLKKIENGLINCIGAIYLISPISVKRNWVNFELGAVWIRNVISMRATNVEIPAIPVCHSGISPGTLPSPLNNLNAILGNQASQLEFAFRSLQTVVGGKGTLKTDFNVLAAQVAEFERQYTLGSSLKKLLAILGGQISDIISLIQHCEQQPTGGLTTMQCGFIDTYIIQELQALEANELKGVITVVIGKAGINFSDKTRTVNGANVSVLVPVNLILEFKEQLIA